jgi:hypothetical protein
MRGYGVVFVSFFRLIRVEASFASLSRADLALLGSAISLLMSRSIASPDFFLAIRE